MIGREFEAVHKVDRVRHECSRHSLSLSLGPLNLVLGNVSRVKRDDDGDDPTSALLRTVPLNLFGLLGVG